MGKTCIVLALLAAGALLVGSGGASLDGVGEITAEIIAGEVSLGRFTPLESPSFEVEVLNLVDPMVGTTKIPGVVRVKPLRFQMGPTVGAAVSVWKKEVEGSAPAPAGAMRQGVIILYDDTGTEFARWSFENGWPSLVSGFKVVRSGFMGSVVDVLELQVDRLVRIEPPAGEAQK